MSTPTPVEHKASTVLQVGVWSSAMLMGFGLLLALVRGIRPEDTPAMPTFGAIVRGAIADPLHPVTLLYAGLLVLMFTPILRVIAALIGFAGVRDRRFVLVSAVVLVLLLGEVCYSIILK